MPGMLKCPNCNAPLATPPSGPAAKCNYCGAALVATQYMPAPGAPQGTPGGGWSPPQQVPGGPPGQVPWSEGPVGQQVPGWTPQQQAAAARSGRAFGIILALIFTLVPAGVGVFFALRAQETVQNSFASTRIEIPGAVSTRSGGVRMPVRTLAIGKSLSVDLPGEIAMRELVVPFTLDVPEQAGYEVSLIGSPAFVSCTVRAADADDKLIMRSSKGTFVQFFPELPEGTVNLYAHCDGHPSERNIRIAVRPLLVLEPGTAVAGAMEADMQSAGAAFVVEEAGLYVAAVEGDLAYGTLELVSAGDTLVGKGDWDSSADAAFVEERLEPGAYLMMIKISSGGSTKVPLTFAVNRVEPEPLTLGEEVESVLSRFTPRRYWTVTLEEPSKLKATLNTNAFSGRVEIQQADGVRIVQSDYTYNRTRRVSATTDTELAAGTYRIVVLEESTEPAEGAFTLTVALEPPPRRGRGGR